VEDTVIWGGVVAGNEGLQVRSRVEGYGGRVWREEDVKVRGGASLTQEEEEEREREREREKFVDNQIDD
jgi:hypothetical protein